MKRQNRMVTDPVERAAFDALDREFRLSLVRYYGKRVKETDEIEDLVQETFLRLVKREQITDIEHLRGYVFQTASSVLNDWLRWRRSRNVDKHDQILDEGLVDTADFSGERVLMGKRKLARVTAIIMEMPERTRTVFVLRRLEGMRYKEISKRLAMPIRTVERHVARGVAHLAARLEGE